MSKNILAIYPHPDDETIVGAGTLMQHVKAGDTITLICATSGQMGRRMGVPFFANRETLPLVREKELRKACEIIGIHNLHLWRMQDKTLQFRSRLMLANKVLHVIDEVKPHIVYTFYPNHGVHPDHDALSAASVVAVNKLSKEMRPEIRCAAMTKDRFEKLGKPDVKIDVSMFIDDKMDAIRAHKSQTEALFKRLDKQLAENPHQKEEILAAYLIEKYWIYELNNNNVNIKEVV